MFKTLFKVLSIHPSGFVTGGNPDIDPNQP